ncbi:MAG: RnfABCDGE type electron transport complex subunit D [Elusimicrobiota bacterium]
MAEKFIVEVSPHIRSNNSVQSIMRDVIIALMPALFVSVYVFGLRTLFVVLLSVSTAVLTEHLFCLAVKKQSTVLDLSAVVSGLLFAFVIPPGLSFILVIIGSAIAMLLGKLIFGGLSHNPFNPALVGRAVLLASWPIAMTTWYKPFWYKYSIDSITCATPLAIVKMQLADNLPSYKDLFFGFRSGCIGEISILALIIGAMYLLIRRIIDLYIPLSYIVTVAVISFFMGANPLFHVLSGGLVLGAFFMATDYSTSPLLPFSKILFGIGCGVLTVLIRLKGGFPEGVCYSILIMNMLTPILDYYVKPFRYGGRI